jgi:hypothetical protein
VKHDHDDATIGGYLAGELAQPERDAFEQHLLTCERCWAEVDCGRRGRTLAERAREPAPDQLRDQVLAAVAAAQPTRRRRPHTRVLVAAAAVALIAAVTTLIAVRAANPAAQPAPIAAAVAGYRDDRLPGSGIPDRAGPDLSTLRLAEAGAGTGHLAGQPVTGYAYRDNTGRRVLIYQSNQPFPMPERADHPTGPSGAAITTHRGVAVLCSRHPYETLILGDDQHLVWRVATALDLI